MKMMLMNSQRRTQVWMVHMKMLCSLEGIEKVMNDD
jgi:hypothetical protein